MLFSGTIDQQPHGMNVERLRPLDLRLSNTAFPWRGVCRSYFGEPKCHLDPERTFHYDIGMRWVTEGEVSVSAVPSGAW